MTKRLNEIRSWAISLYFLIPLLIILLSGCGIVPWPLSVAHTAADVVLANQTGKVSTEHLAGVVTQRDCQWSRILEEKKVCMTRDEYVDYLLEKCIEGQMVTWNWLGQPKCKKVLDNSQ